MRDYVVCRCAPLADTLECAPVKFPDYELESLHIGPTGAFAIAGNAGEASPEAIHRHLREFLGTTRVGIYLLPQNLLVSFDGTTELSLGESELQTVIQDHTRNGHFLLWDPDSLHRLSEKIRYEDARNRGIYRDNDGNWFIEQHGKFRPLSDKDPDKILRMAVYSGTLGLHRFALGKWGTGLLYLLTGGLMGLGWFMDLFQIHMGTITDKKKRLLPKPELLSPSRYLVGAAANTALFCTYCIVTGMISAFTA